MLNKKSVDDINVKGKKVLVRCDFNVPLKDGVVKDVNGNVISGDTVIPEAGLTVVIDIEASGMALGDIHVHGGGGADFMDATPEAFETAVKSHLKHGTTTMLATADYLWDFDELMKSIKKLRLLELFRQHKLC